MHDVFLGEEGMGGGEEVVLLWLCVIISQE